MGKCKTANKGAPTPPFPSLQDGEEDDMVWDPIEEIASVEEVLLHLGTSPKSLLDSGQLVDYHQRGWCPLSIGGTTQPPQRIEGTIVFG